MDRSAMFAGDLSRLLANYDVSQGKVATTGGVRATTARSRASCAAP
jgi:hypothetical protein